MAGQGTGSGYFWVRRLHSLAGVLLSVAYVVGFIIPFSVAFGGAVSFNRFAAAAARVPFLDVVEILCFVVPLLFHAAVGLAIIYGSQVNVVAYGFYRNWMVALQRVTGLVLLAFFAYHVATVRLAFAFTGRFPDFAFLQKHFAPSWVKGLYLAGVICAAFHIGNGIAGALARWGITQSRRAQDAAAMAMWVVTLVLAAWGARIVLAF